MKEVKTQIIEAKIYVIRNRRVMLDADLAELYGVETKVLKQAVKRNLKRFPDDFMFIPNNDDLKDLRSQFVTSNDPSYWNHTWAEPFLFTENGVAMLSSILKSDRAIEMNISIMRVFNKLRSFPYLESELKKEFKDFKQETINVFKIVFERMESIEEIIEPKVNPKRKKIGLKD